MQAEIITIGDEILIGQILDTNSKWIAEELNKIGMSVYQITSIQDDKLHILKALKEAQENVDIVIITGGLGPTKDDITKHSLAAYFDSELEINEEILTHVKGIFAKSTNPFSEINRLQALVPKKCTPLHNSYGTAPGMWFEFNNKIVISLPGVPNEMKGLIQDEVLPRIQKQYHLPFIVHKTIVTYGKGESWVAELIEDWEDALPDFIKLAYLPNYGKLRLRLSAKGSNLEVLETTLNKNIEKLKTIIGDIIIGYDDSETIEVAIGKILKEKKLTLATAESCTGGAIAKAITSVPGASAYFTGSIISYNVNVKINELNISKALIDTYSVVSSEVVEAMAISIQQKLNVDFAIATTGNAGPTTDLTDKTVGTIFIGIATPNGVYSEEFNFGKPREKVIERTTIKALELLRKKIIKNT